jgi:hypothetical protein
MSFLAKLEMDSKEYNILNVEYDITQMVDSTHRPNGDPRGGLIQVTLESSSDKYLLEWAIQHSMVKDGKIVFYRRDANSQMKTIKFKNAFCIYLKEIFTADGKNPMVTRMTISAHELEISNQKLKNAWPGMNSASNSDSDSGSEITSFKADSNH